MTHRGAKRLECVDDRAQFPIAIAVPTMRTISYYAHENGVDIGDLITQCLQEWLDRRGIVDPGRFPY